MSLRAAKLTNEAKPCRHHKPELDNLRYICSKLFGRKPASLLPPLARDQWATPLTYRADPSPRDSTTYCLGSA